MINCFINKNVYDINSEISQKIYQEMIDVIKPKDCYNNILKVAVKFKSEFESNGWLVAFCYKDIGQNLYARHCAIINTNNEIIDPTHFSLSINNLENAKYLVFDTLERKEFFKLVCENGWNASLLEYYRKQEAENIVSAWERGKKIFGL